MGRSAKAFINDDLDNHHPAAGNMVDGVQVLGSNAFVDLGHRWCWPSATNARRRILADLLPVEWASAIHSTALPGWQ